MGEFSSTTLLIAISLLPGYFFTNFISRYNFPSGRSSSSKVTLLIASFFFSLLILRIYDSPTVKSFAVKILYPAVKFIQNDPAETAYIQLSKSVLRDFNTVIFPKFSEQNIQDKPLEIKLPQGKEKSVIVFYPDNSQKNTSRSIELSETQKKISGLLDTIVFYVTPFSILFTVFFSFLIHCLESIIRFPVRNGFYLLVLLIELIFKLLIEIILYLPKKTMPVFLKKSKFAVSHNWEKQIKNPSNWFVALAVLGIPTYIIFAILIGLILISSLVLVWSIYYLASLIYMLINQILSLFKHPAERHFYSSTHNSKDYTCIAEILDSTETLYKGRFLTFDPRNADQLELITIDHVIQYKKITDAVFFKRGTRIVNSFVNEKSKFSIQFQDIKNINIWFLDHSSFNLDLPVTNEDSLNNYIWYLSLILSFHRASFTLEKIKPQISVNMIPIFFIKFLILLEHHYSGNFYGYKKRRLLFEFTKLAAANLQKNRVFYRTNQTPESFLQKEQRTNFINKLSESLRKNNSFKIKSI